MLYEVIEDDLAREIIQKQSTNQQVHTPLDFLLNERGERYQQAPVTAPSYEQQGEVVASIEQTGQGRYTQDNTEVRRNAGPPQIANVPGSVGNPVPEVPSHIPAEQVADWVARNYGDAAGEALRASLNVSVAPTQREITPGQ